MGYQQYKLESKSILIPQVFSYTLRAINLPIKPFLPGQYIFIKNPQYLPEEEHPFSLVSSPPDTTTIIICMKVYGDWTEEFTKLEVGSPVFVSDPYGSFIWDKSIEHAVFLLGGIGISPIISILRFLSASPKKPSSLTLLYGNLTPQSVVYRNELEQLQHLLPLRVIDIYSNLPQDDPWTGHRGFITPEIIAKEGGLMRRPTFFIVGPPIFIEKMQAALQQLRVDNLHIKKETISKPPSI